VHQAFLAINKDLLSQFPGISWYSPEDLGGLGLRIISTTYLGSALEDVDAIKTTVLYGPTALDVACEDWLRANPASNWSKRMPTDAPIQIRKVWTTLIPFNPRPQFEREGFKDFRTQLFDMSEDDIGFLDVATYYIAPTLVKTQLKQDPFRVLHTNQKIWRQVRGRVLRNVKVSESTPVAVPGLD
jgi:hypothetical protein